MSDATVEHLESELQQLEESMWELRRDAVNAGFSNQTLAAIDALIAHISPLLERDRLAIANDPSCRAQVEADCRVSCAELARVRTSLAPHIRPSRLN